MVDPSPYKDVALKVWGVSKKVEGVTKKVGGVRTPPTPQWLRPCPQSFCHSFIALCLSIIRCLKSAQKSAVQVCQVAACCYGNHTAGSKPI